MLSERGEKIAPAQHNLVVALLIVITSSYSHSHVEADVDVDVDVNVDENLCSFFLG